MDDKKLDVKFVSRDCSYARRSTRPRDRGNYGRDYPYEGSLMALKIGICAVVFALVLLLKLVDVPFSQTVLGGIQSALSGDEEGEDETLGKLKFVELPGILSVFAGGDSLTAPLDGEAHLLDDYMLRFERPAGESVVVAGEGVVKAVGEDAALGPCVVVRHEGDIETYYYGLSDISVEEGQPLQRLDTIGKTGEGGLVFQVRSQGVPCDAAKHISVDIAD